jgi:drug/metabolite transporter (DMT)-like permease
MPPVAAVLLILSAAVHAGWNLISKRYHPTLAFFLAANNFGLLLVLLAASPYWDRVTMIPAFVWICGIGSGFFLTVYMAGLAAAYQTGDMSVAYPLIRALPVLLITAVTMIFSLGKPVGGVFVAGAVLVVIGCMLLPMQTRYHFNPRNYLSMSCLMAVVAAIGCSGYTVVDHEAMRYLSRLPEPPFSPLEATLLYICLEAVSGSFWMTIFVLASARERGYFREVMSRHQASAAFTGFGIYLTYGLVLLAMNFVSNVSYVAAFRQLSIPLGAVLGIVILREPPYRIKIFGILAVFAGLVLVGLFEPQ